MQAPGQGRRRRSARALTGLVACTAALLGGCGRGAAGTPPLVVAAENAWGSIARQLAGTRVGVQSIVVDPGADPHSYQPTAADGRALAISSLAIVNGLGYDPWASKLLAAGPSRRRAVITVGDLLGLRLGDNPHRWYSPADVESVANAITARLRQLEPEHAAYFNRLRAQFETQGIARYHALIADIRTRFAGVRVGASESIFAPLAPSLGLKLITPARFMNAISEGTEPTAADKRLVDGQIANREIKVWLYNPQNSTPDIQRLTSEARARGIPVAAVAETLSPASATFGEWQAAQLQLLEQALRGASGK